MPLSQASTLLSKRGRGSIRVLEEEEEANTAALAWETMAAKEGP